MSDDILPYELLYLLLAAFSLTSYTWLPITSLGENFRAVSPVLEEITSIWSSNTINFLFFPFHLAAILVVSYVARVDPPSAPGENWPAISSPPNAPCQRLRVFGSYCYGNQSKMAADVIEDGEGEGGKGKG